MAVGHRTQDPAGPGGSDILWLQPIPDALVGVHTGDPAVIVTARESIRLARAAALQYLTPRQRAVLAARAQASVSGHE